MQTEKKSDITNVRVIQRTLVYVIGIPQKYAQEELLKNTDYFGQFGTIKKLVVNKRVFAVDSTCSAYVTFKDEKDAYEAIAETDESLLDGKAIKSTYGTTKYCAFYLKNTTCQNYDCMYLHCNGETKDAITKDEMYVVKHKLHDFEPRNRGRAVLGRQKEGCNFNLLFKYKNDRIINFPEKIKFKPIEM